MRLLGDRPHRAGALVVAAVAALVAGAVFNWGLGTQSYNVWGAMVIVPVIVGIDLALIAWAARREDDPWVTRILLIGFAAKLLGTLARYVVAYLLYGGSADAEAYNRYAAYQYHLWRAGQFAWEWQGKQGTQWMELITTAIYTVIGPSPLAAFFVFGSLAYWGAFLLYRAFRLALPAGDWHRYALGVFLLPSMLFWPSSIGKEAWLMLFVGVTALGAARFFVHGPHSLPLLILGAIGTAIIRPHISILLFGSMLAAQFFRPTGAKATGVLSKVLGLAILGLGSFILTTESAQFLGIDDLSLQAVSDSVDAASEQASQGGSTFDAKPASSPLALPSALMTVLFRPYPWEAHNPQLLMQSLEGAVLLALALGALPRWRSLLRTLRTNPYVAFAFVYVAGFVWAFSGFGNFGILARQRVLMLPMFLVLLALPRTGSPAPESLGRQESHARSG